MRIRGRNPPAPDQQVSLSSPSASASSSVSTYSASSSSSITAAHSSLESSQDSSNSRAFPLLAAAAATTAIHRCAGLDLLVKAIHQVTAGSAVGVPYIQRRVTIRRSRRRRDFQFDAFIFAENFGKKLKGIKKKPKKGKNSVSKVRQKSAIGLASKVPDTILQSWGRRSTAADVIGV